MTDFTKVAERVLSIAVAFDQRLARPVEQMKHTIMAWGMAFEHKVWAEEGIEAVKQHYSKPNAFPIQPGDVIDFCNHLEPWSSRERARDFLWRWCEYPYSHHLGEFTGVEEPNVDTNHPSDAVRRSTASTILKKWVSENETELIEAALERKHRFTR